MEITIDVDALRNDLIDYYGSATPYYPIATADLVKAETASDKEVVEMALKNGFNLYDYEINNKRKGR